MTEQLQYHENVDWEQAQQEALKIIEGAEQTGMSVAEYMNTMHFTVSYTTIMCLGAAAASIMLNGSLQNYPVTLKNAVNIAAIRAQQAATASAPGLPNVETTEGRAIVIGQNGPDFMKNLMGIPGKVQQATENLGAIPSNVNVNVLNSDGNPGLNTNQIQAEDIYNLYMNDGQFYNFMNNLPGR